MSYFKNFPKIITTSNNKNIIIKDFLRRVSVSNKFRDTSVALDKYLIKDGETPEIVSQKLYNSVDYFWVILMVNDITDPRSEWPIGNEFIPDLIYLNYDFEMTVTDGSQFAVNDEINSSNGGYFLVSSISGTTLKLRSQYKRASLTSSVTLNNVTKNISGISISSITDPNNETHHYVSSDGYIVDSDYSGATAVSNFEYEISKNDDKRHIRVLPSALIGLFVGQFKNLIK